MLIIWSSTSEHLYQHIIQPTLDHLDIHVKKVQFLEGIPNLKAGDVCLAFGKKALEYFRTWELVPKNRTINSLREQVYTVLNGQAAFLLTFDSHSILTDASKKWEIIWDIQLAVRYHNTGSLEPNKRPYQYVSNLSHLLEKVDAHFEKTQKKIALSVDLETMGLIPYIKDKHIVSIAFTYENGQADIIRFINGKYPQKIIKQIASLLTSPKIKVWGANFKYDKAWMVLKWDLHCTNDSFDTLLVGSLLDENRANSLNSHAKIYSNIGGYDDQFNRDYDKGHMEEVPDDPLLNYAGGDTDACYQSATILRQELAQSRQLANFYTKLMHPASKVFSKMEVTGVLIDPAVYDALEIEVQAEILDINNEAFDMMPRRLRLKYSDNLSLTRNAILSEFLFTPRGLNLKPKLYTLKPDKQGKKRPSCAMEHFELFAEVPEAKRFVELMGRYNSAVKTLSTYIKGFRKHLRADNRYHPNYILYNSGLGGSVSGRTSAKNPAIQTVPHHTKWAYKLRQAFIAPPGYVILYADYSQGELRVAACLANEPTMIAAYKNGVDLHSMTAAKLIGYDFDEFMALPEKEIEAHRFGGKAGNFGLLYGMGWRGFKVYARVTYSVNLTDSQAQQFRQQFLFELYSRLSHWHNECKSFAHKTGTMRSPLGRIRRLPLINSKFNDICARQERQAINFGPQSTLSDMTQLAMVHIDDQLPELDMFGMTHDSIGFYIKKDEVGIYAPKIKSIMENLPLQQDFGWKPQLQFISDIEVSDDHMGNMKKFIV